MLSLPGCMAKAVKKASGEFHIYHLGIDTSYAELAENNEKSGFYSAKKDAQRWNAKRKINGSIDKTSPNQLVGGLNFAGDFAGSIQRFRKEEDYTALQMGVDLASSAGSSWKTVTLASATGVAVTTAMGMGGTAIALPATIAVAGAIAGTGKTLFQAWLPRKYRSLASKL